MSGKEPTDGSRKKYSLMGLVGVVGGAAGAAIMHFADKPVQPLATQVAHQIAQDQPTILFSADPKTVREGELVHVTPVMSGSKLATPGGTLQVICDARGHLEPAGDVQLSVPASDSPMALPIVLCRAKSPGEAMVTGVANFPISVQVTGAPVQVVEAAKSDKATPGNLSGRWSIILGTVSGTMHLLHHEANVGGDYRTDDGRSGSVVGIADGGKFVVQFHDSKAVRGFDIDGNVGGSKDADAMEVTGTASELVANGGGWQRLSGVPIPFHAVSGGPGAAARQATNGLK